MLFLTALVVAIVALFTPVQAEAPSATETVTVQCEEDMECWDSKTMGNQRVLSANELDAWSQFNTVIGTLDLPYSVRVEYVKTVPEQDYVEELRGFKVSASDPTQVHVFTLTSYWEA